MSIVDTWDFSKIDTSVYDDYVDMDVETKLFIALREFEEHYGVRPNKIIMGNKLVNELHAIFCSVKTLELEKKIKYTICEYKGIPINIDYDYPNNLEVGYMARLTESGIEVEE